MDNFQTQFENYAELAIRLGVNLQSGQLLVIDASVEAVDFVRILVEKAYDAGAKSVHVEWSDEHVYRTKLLRSSMEALQEYPAWKAEGYTNMAKQGGAFITVHCPQPELMQDVPTERITSSGRAAQLALQEYRRYRMSDKVSWLGMALPTQAWANQVFPDLPEEKRLSSLWETVFRVTRANQSNPLEAWGRHIKNLKERLDLLNAAQYKCLRYQAPGTDLHIDLPENHIWVGGGAKTVDGVFFVPNIPTEECFTAPVRTGVNGTVRSTKPLFSAGKVIEDFSITFKDGCIVDYTAKVGLDTLKSIIETDEGSRFLGEVALVPQSSPISMEGVTFYNTLFDENASCHLAIGAAYAMNLQGGTSMSKEELIENGINSSITHVDFMIGSAELDIDAQTARGEWVPLFRAGEWV